MLSRHITKEAYEERNLIPRKKWVLRADTGDGEMSPVLVDQDEYDTVLNSDATYRGLADLLKHDSVVFVWTDQEGTQLDILMAYMPVQFGHLQRGMSASTDLFVAVSHFGMFGFELNGIEKHAGYVGEKLNLHGVNTTTEKLAELINGVCRELER